MNDTDKHDAELAHERVISADLRADLRALQAQAAARDEEIERLRSSTWTDYIEADTHNEIVRDLQARVAKLEAALARWDGHDCYPRDGGDL